MYWTMVESESREVVCSIWNVVMSSARGVPKIELSKIGSCAFEALSVYIWLQKGHQLALCMISSSEKCEMILTVIK